MTQSSKTRPRRPARAEPAASGGLGGLLSPRLFKALSDPKRVSLLARLAEGGGPQTVGHVARGSGVDLSVVSRHLAILRDAGVIRCVKRGKEVHCAVQTGALARVLRELADALEACCPAEPGAARAEASRTEARPPGARRRAGRTGS